MSYAVVETVTAYHPEGDESREKTTQFIYWIFKLKYQAEASLKKLQEMDPAGCPNVSIIETDEEAWS